MESEDATPIVDRPRAYETVVSAVEEAIADGRYVPGARLPSERLLAENFGVSRVVIREAMRALESRGYVRVRQGSGTYISASGVRALSQDVTLRLELEEASLVELYVVRQSLELASARLAADHGTTEHVDKLDALIEDTRKLTQDGIFDFEDYVRFMHLDEEFHLAVAVASGNRALISLLSAVLPLFTLGRKELMRKGDRVERFGSPERLALVVQEHSDMTTALRNRDGRAAEYFMYGHMQRSIASWTDGDSH